MAYYMRSNDAHDDSRYMMHAWGDGKGSWGQHKYIDKRWLNGAWKYLYELPKNVGQAARNAGQTVKNTAQQAKKTFNNFRNYSTNVDTKASQASEKKQQNQRTGQRITSSQQANSRARAESVAKEQAAKEQNQRDKNAVNLASDRYMKSYSDAQKWQANEDQLAKMRADISAGKDVDYNKMSQLEEENRRLTDEAHRYEANNSEKWLNTAREREKQSSQNIEAEKAKQREYDQKSADLQAQKEQNDKEYFANQVAEERANAEKETLKYKASRFLDNILDRADEVTASGASWLKNQMESGNEWVTNTIASIGNKGEESLQTIQNLFGKKEEAIETRSMPEKSTGRQYNATSQKAEVKKSEADQKYDAAKTSFDKKYGSGSDFDERDRQITNQLRNLRDRGATDTAVYQRLMGEKNRMWDEANAALAEVNRLDDERRKSGVGGSVASTRDRRSYSNRSK